jgi:hypothetical protein
MFECVVDDRYRIDISTNLRDFKVNKKENRSQFWHDFSGSPSVEYAFEPAKIYAMVWDTNRRVYTEPWPFTFDLLQSKEWRVVENGTKCSLFQKDRNLAVEAILNEPVFNVTGTRMTADHSPNSICGLQINAIETKDNCEEPDSPIYGQHV